MSYFTVGVHSSSGDVLEREDIAQQLNCSSLSVLKYPLYSKCHLSHHTEK